MIIKESSPSGQPEKLTENARKILRSYIRDAVLEDEVPVYQIPSEISFIRFYSAAHFAIDENGLSPEEFLNEVKTFLESRQINWVDAESAITAELDKYNRIGTVTRESNAAYWSLFKQTIVEYYKLLQEGIIDDEDSICDLVITNLGQANFDGLLDWYESIVAELKSKGLITYAGEGDADNQNETEELDSI